MTVAAAAATDPAAPAAAAAAAQQGSYDIFSGLPVPGGLSERLWSDTQAEVMEALHHPFVQALAAGTLDRWVKIRCHCTAQQLRTACVAVCRLGSVETGGPASYMLQHLSLLSFSGSCLPHKHVSWLRLAA
jgi:hypothetical protein